MKTVFVCQVEYRSGFTVTSVWSSKEAANNEFLRLARHLWKREGHQGVMPTEDEALHQFLENEECTYFIEECELHE